MATSVLEASAAEARRVVTVTPDLERVSALCFIIVKRVLRGSLKASCTYLKLREIVDASPDPQEVDQIEDWSIRRYGLTEREMEILRLLAEEGLKNEQIARRLYVAQQTVKFHLSNIYRKLSVHSRTQAVRVWHEKAA